jgi:hypothetical protein
MQIIHPGVARRIAVKPRLTQDRPPDSELPRYAGGVPRLITAVLVALSVAVSAVVGIVHGALITIMIACAALAAGFAAWLSSSPTKKTLARST